MQVEEGVLPLKIRRDGQRLLEILPPHQPISVLNSFPLELNHHSHYLEIIRMSMPEFILSLHHHCFLCLPLTL